MMAYELENVAILNVKGVDYRCVLLNMTKYDEIKLLNNPLFDNKAILLIDFGANIAPVEVIKFLLEKSILVLTVNGIKTHGKNLMS